jgi:hypothetical protein
MVSLKFFIDVILPAALESMQPLIEMSTRNISGGWSQLVRRACNLVLKSSSLNLLEISRPL